MTAVPMSPQNQPIALAQPKAGMMCSMSLSEYIKFCCTGIMPAVVEHVRTRSAVHDALVCWSDLLGILEPACATRPDACEPELRILRYVDLPPATINEAGQVVPSEERIISICAPMNKALMVAELNVEPENLTAQRQPYTLPIYKRVNIASFPDGFCLPFDPADQPGLFVNVQHLMMPAKSGFSAYVKNWDPTSPASFSVRGRMWACC